MSFEQHRESLRNALLAVLFLRAKLRAETGAVPAEIQQRIDELSGALGDCTIAINRLRTRRAIEQVGERANHALAAAEVELSLG